MSEKPQDKKIEEVIKKTVEEEVVPKLFLSADAILGAQDLLEEDVHTPEWKHQGAEWVRIREMTAADRDWIEASMLADGQDPTKISLENIRGRKIGAELFRAKLVAVAIIDPKSKKRLFTNAQVEKLSLKSSKVIARIAEAAVRLNGMSDDEVKTLGEDFERAQNVVSSSDSLSSSDVPLESSTEDSVQES